MSKIYEALQNAERENGAALKKGSSLAPGPGEEKKPSLALGPREEKKPSPVLEPKEEKRPSLAPGPREEKKPSFAPGPREEKKPSPVLEPKEEKRPSLAPGPREEKKPSPVLEPKEEKRPSLAPGPREEKKPSFALGPKEERMERPKMVHKPVRPDRTGSFRPLVSLSQPGSLGAEQFRRLRTHLLRPDVLDAPKTIMVTSATEGEGKTFVAANLAAGIAHDLHFHALLVDCDIRSPSLSQWFGIQNGHGLSDYLVGRGNLSELLMKTEMDKLSILTGGSAQEKPAELIGSRRMEALVHELKLRYNDRYIIFDTTPLLATTEPEVLARLVDGILIVVRAGVTPRETVKQAIASLDPKKIMGFVLNDVTFKSSGLSSRYFGSDGYYTSYGYGKRGAEPRTQAREVSPLRKRSD